MGEPCYCGLDITRMECVKTFVFQVRIELNDATDKSHSIGVVGEINPLRLERMGLCLRLIRDTRLITGSFLSAKSDPLVHRRICWRRCLRSSRRLVTASRLSRPDHHLRSVSGRDQGINCRPDRVCPSSSAQAPCNRRFPILFSEVDVDRSL
jgi:hypothetical protein